MKRMLAIALAIVTSGLFAGVDLNNVDDLKLLAMRVYGVRKAVPQSDKTVKIVLGSSFTDARRETEAYRIISTDDPTYAYDKFVRPAEVKTAKETIEFARPPAFWANAKANLDLRRVEVTITLPEPMKPGCHYSILAQGLGKGGGQQVTSGTCAACFTYQGKDPKWDSEDGDYYAETMSGLRKVSSIGDGILLCEFGHAYSESSGKKLANWKVTINGKKCDIIELGRRSLLECYNPTGGWGGQFGAFMYNNVYIRLANELKDGDKVKVEVTGQITTANKEAGFTFDAKKSVSRSIKVNQVGYITDGLKVAYIGEWLGSMPEQGLVSADVKTDAPIVFSLEEYYTEAGKGTQEERDLAQKAEAKAREEEQAAALEAAKAAGGSVYDYDKLAPFALRFKTVPKFRICDAKSGKTVFEGDTKFIHNGYYDEGSPIDGQMSAENVYEIDFTAFKKSGTYFISVDGVGRSYTFDIAPDVYEKAFKVSAQGMYEQRCGCPLDPKLTGGWPRISCHDTGIITTTEKRYLNGAWGQFMDNCEKDPNPAYPPVKAAREKVENDPSQVKLTFKTIGNTKEVKDDRFGTAYMTGEGDSNGVETQYTIDPTKGCTFTFFTKRIDSFAQNKWGGDFMKFGGKPGINLGLSWGMIAGIGRLNWPKSPWHHMVVRIQPADEKGKSKAEILFNGEVKTGLTREVEIAKLDPTIGLGYVNWDAAEGTYFAGFRMYAKALSDQELKDLTATVPETLPHKIQAKGGHHDAGDYNPRSHIDVAQSLLYGYELNPSAFKDNQLPVPEHNNGIPDIIDEALWAVKLWEGLQCEDGGVYNGTEAQGDPNFVQTVELDDKGDFTWAKDTKGSYLAAAIFAQSARVLKPFDKKRSKELLDRAVRAYNWAVKNPDTGFTSLSSYGEYNHSLRAYAAAELYHTTYEKKYHKDFCDNVPYGKIDGAELEIYRYYDCTLACYSYALIPEDKCDPKVRAGVIAAIEKQVDMYIRNCDKLAMKFIKHAYSPVTWGSGAYENFAVPVAFMWGIEKDPAKKSFYRDWLIRTCDNTLGANPMGMCWMTGLGTRGIRCPLHNSRYRAAGIAADGLQGQGPMQHGQGYCFTDTSYPWFRAGQTKMHIFADVHFCIVMDEPTANNMANTMMIFGILCK